MKNRPGVLNTRDGYRAEVLADHLPSCHTRQRRKLQCPEKAPEPPRVAAQSVNARMDGEARFTVGRDPGTGKQVQRIVYGSTQNEVRPKLAQAVADLDSGDGCHCQRRGH